MREETVYNLRYVFDWRAGCLWPGDDHTARDLGLGPYDGTEPCPLPLSGEILER